MKKNMHNSKAKPTSLMFLLVSAFLLSALAGTQFVGRVSAAWPYDWPMFRHDLQHTGYSPSPAPNTNQTLWNYTLGSDAGATGSAVADGRVYVGSWDFNVYCLDAATGALVWNYTTGDYVECSPSVADSKVYIGSSDGNVYCLNALTGAFIWSYTTGSDVHPSFAVANGVVYVCSGDYRVYAFSAGTPIPEGLTIGVMVLISSVAVIVSCRYFRKRPKIESCGLGKP